MNSRGISKISKSLSPSKNHGRIEQDQVQDKQRNSYSGEKDYNSRVAEESYSSLPNNKMPTPEKINVLQLLKEHRLNNSPTLSDDHPNRDSVENLESPKLSTKMQTILQAHGNLSENIIQNAFKVVDDSRIKVEDRDLEVELELGKLKLQHLEKKIETHLQSSKDTLTLNAQLSENVLNLLHSEKISCSSLSPNRPRSESKENHLPTFYSEKREDEEKKKSPDLKKLKNYVSKMAKNVSFEDNREFLTARLGSENPNVSGNHFSFNAQTEESPRKNWENKRSRENMCSCNGVNLFQGRKLFVKDLNGQGKGYLVKPIEVLSIQKIEPIIIHPIRKPSQQRIKSKFVEGLKTEEDEENDHDHGGIHHRLHSEENSHVNTSDLERSRKENSRGVFVNNILEYMQNKSRGSPFGETSKTHFPHIEKTDSKSSFQNIEDFRGSLERVDTNSNKNSEFPTDTATPQNQKPILTSMNEIKTMETMSSERFQIASAKKSELGQKLGTTPTPAKTESSPLQIKKLLTDLSNSSLKKKNPGVVTMKSTLDSIQGSSSTNFESQRQDKKRPLSNLRSEKDPQRALSRQGSRDLSVNSMQRSSSFAILNTPMKNRYQNRSSIKKFAIGKDWEALLDYDPNRISANKNILRKRPGQSSPKKDQIPKLIVNLFSKTLKY